MEILIQIFCIHRNLKMKLEEAAASVHRKRNAFEMHLNTKINYCKGHMYMYACTGGHLQILCTWNTSFPNAIQVLLLR